MVNRAQLQQLAQGRVEDAEVLIRAGRWSAAYYLAGYALELGPKSCVLHHIELNGLIFSDKSYLSDLSKCWTHDLPALMKLAGFTSEFGLACQADPILDGYWGVAKDWREVSRYQQKSQAEAEALFEAITNDPGGVLPWMRTRR